MAREKFSIFWDSVDCAEVPGECQHVPPVTVFVKVARKLGHIPSFEKGVEFFHPSLHYLERRTRQRLLESDSRQIDRAFSEATDPMMN